MAELVRWHIASDVRVTTYGMQPCEHGYDRREFGNRVFWTMPRAIVFVCSDQEMVICASCVAEQEQARVTDHFYQGAWHTEAEWQAHLLEQDRNA